MADFQLKLTPDVVNMATEGSLDSSVSDGVSYQRTGYIDVYNGPNRKIVEVADGETFDDAMTNWDDEDYIEDA